MKQSMIAEFAKILGTTVEYLVCGVIKESRPDASSAEMLQLFSSMDEQTNEKAGTKEQYNIFPIREEVMGRRTASKRNFGK